MVGWFHLNYDGSLIPEYREGLPACHALPILEGFAIARVPYIICVAIP